MKTIVRGRLMAAVAAVGISFAGFATDAFAAAGWEFATAGNSFTNGTWDFATAFTVNNNVTLTGLGYYADPRTGNVDSNPVAFYQCADAQCLTTGTLLATATVTNVYPVSGHFRYVTIAPINLIAGVSYEVAGVSNSDNYTWADSGFFTNPDITILTSSGQSSRWQSLSTPNFLTGSGSLDRVGQDGYWGPNIFLGAPVFTGEGAVPEPATWAMMLAGFGLVGAAMRRRQQVARTSVSYA